MYKGYGKSLFGTNSLESAETKKLTIEYKATLEGQMKFCKKVDTFLETSGTHCSVNSIVNFV